MMRLGLTRQLEPNAVVTVGAILQQSSFAHIWRGAGRHRGNMQGQTCDWVERHDLWQDAGEDREIVGPV